MISVEFANHTIDLKFIIPGFIKKYKSSSTPEKGSDMFIFRTIFRAENYLTKKGKAIMS